MTEPVEQGLSGLSYLLFPIPYFTAILGNTVTLNLAAPYGTSVSASSGSALITGL